MAGEQARWQPGGKAEHKWHEETFGVDGNVYLDHGNVLTGVCCVKTYHIRLFNICSLAPANYTSTKLVEKNRKEDKKHKK